MTDTTDSIERLRSERPAIDLPDPLEPDRAPTRLGSRRAPRRRRLQVAFVAVAATAIVLTGAIALRSTEDGATQFTPGITGAEARELAAAALTNVAELDEWSMTSRWSNTELDGEKVMENGYRITSTDAGKTMQQTWRNDFVGQASRTSLETRIVDGRKYQESGSDRFGTAWILAARDLPPLGQSSEHVSGFAYDMFTPPDFSQFVAQLQREGLVDARREADGTVVIGLDRPAAELAPVDGAAIVSDGRFGGRGVDPIASFASGIAHRAPDRRVQVEISIDADGSLNRIRMSADRVETSVGARAPQPVVLTRTVSVMSWQRPQRNVVAPDPSDVTVVGDATRARRGEIGVAGPHGTLDAFTAAELEALRVKAQAEQFRLQRTRMRQQPSRTYPKLWTRRKAEMVARRRAIARFAPFDRADLARNAACTPYWPDTGRAMAGAEARRDPDAAGWKCLLPDGIGGFSIAPGSTSPMPFERGGMTIMSTSG